MVSTYINYNATCTELSAALPLIVNTPVPGTLTLSAAEHAVLWHDLYGAHGPLLPSRVRRALAR
jgi:hypothetical protein